MSPSTPTNGTPSLGPERHESSDGTTFWGDIPLERFDRAADRFPVLKYVIEEYFASPEQKSKDGLFVSHYQQLGEESSEFDGFIDDLEGAIRQYSLAAALVNGLMGIDLSSKEVRSLLASLKDQVLQQGEFDPSPSTEEGGSDPFKVSDAGDRVKASFLLERELPFGLAGGKRYPVVYYLAAAVGVVALGMVISFIPIIGDLGRILIFVGGIACFVFAVGILAIRSEYMNPDEAKEREEKKKEIEEKKKEKKNRGGVLRRLNPFAN